MERGTSIGIAFLSCDTIQKDTRNVVSDTRGSGVDCTLNGN